MKTLPTTSAVMTTPPDLVKIEVARGNRIVRLTPRGEIDLSNANVLRDALVAEILPGIRVFLDLSELDFMDSSGIRVLLEAKARAQKADVFFSITSVSRAVGRVLEIAGLKDRLLVDPGALRN
jgi:anti-sigma B factor antagonist